MAELVRAGEVTASELLEEAITRAESVNPGVNAIVTPMYEVARKRALASPTGPFGGSGENGLTGIAVDPANGDVFVTMLYDDPTDGTGGPARRRGRRSHAPAGRSG